MTREFRGYYMPQGYEIGDGEWIYGYLCDESTIKDKYGQRYACVENSIGQYTGRKDINKVKIYEGDIFIAPFDHGTCWMYKKGVISFDIIRGYQWEYWNVNKLEIIGTYFENPKLRWEV